MKISAAIIIASVASASAFVPVVTKSSQQSTQLHIATKGKAAPVRKASKFALPYLLQINADMKQHILCSI